MAEWKRKQNFSLLTFVLEYEYNELFTVRSDTLGGRVGDQRGDKERDSGVVREGRDQGEGGELLAMIQSPH